MSDRGTVETCLRRRHARAARTLRSSTGAQVAPTRTLRAAERGRTEKESNALPRLRNATRLAGPDADGGEPRAGDARPALLPLARHAGGAADGGGARQLRAFHPPLRQAGIRLPQHR